MGECVLCFGVNVFCGMGCWVIIVVFWVDFVGLVCSDLSGRVEFCSGVSDSVVWDWCWLNVFVSVVHWCVKFGWNWKLKKLVGFFGWRWFHQGVLRRTERATTY